MVLLPFILNYCVKRGRDRQILSTQRSFLSSDLLACTSGVFRWKLLDLLAKNTILSKTSNDSLECFKLETTLSIFSWIVSTLNNVFHFFFCHTKNNSLKTWQLTWSSFSVCTADITAEVRFIVWLLPLLHCLCKRPKSQPPPMNNCRLIIECSL